MRTDVVNKYCNLGCKQSSRSVTCALPRAWFGSGRVSGASGVEEERQRRRGRKSSRRRRHGRRRRRPNTSLLFLSDNSLVVVLQRVANSICPWTRSLGASHLQRRVLVSPKDMWCKRAVRRRCWGTAPMKGEPRIIFRA